MKMQKSSMMGGGGGMGGGACYVYPGAPSTPGLVTADIVFKRGIYMNGTLNLDDGNSVQIWGFADLAAGGGGGMGGQFPSPLIRVRQGQIVHTELTVQGDMWLHTIHHHGIEPAWQNDGVGHISWDVDGVYTYQWKPAHAGTYFYHCHTNTVLHAEMGMYGAIIVDPPTGPGRVYSNGPNYDLEVVWACDDIDASWHNLPWDAGTCGADVGLNDHYPDYFIITGVDGAQSALTAPGVAVTMSRGQRLLARYIHAGYHPQRIHFGGLTATVVASEGRPLPVAIQVTELEAHSAERYDCIFEPTEAGVYEITVEYLHWITLEVMGTARTRVTVL